MHLLTQRTVLVQYHTSTIRYEYSAHHFRPCTDRRSREGFPTRLRELPLPATLCQSLTHLSAPSSTPRNRLLPSSRARTSIISKTRGTCSPMVVSGAILVRWSHSTRASPADEPRDPHETASTLMYISDYENGIGALINDVFTSSGTCTLYSYCPRSVACPASQFCGRR
jgi:hypothetical protein